MTTCECDAHPELMCPRRRGRHLGAESAWTICNGCTVHGKYPWCTSTGCSTDKLREP